MSTPWKLAWDRGHLDPEFIDLTDSRFHQNGLLPDRGVFERAFQRWLDTRVYEPDSRGQLEARKSLSAFYKTQGWLLSENDLFLTAGTSEAYALLFSTLASPDDSVLLPQPGYPLFEQLARHSRLQTVTYPLLFSEGWEPDVGSLERAVGARTKFVILISPNNPTGQTVSAGRLAEIAEVCRRHRLVVIVDEVFDACWEGPESLPRFGALFPDVRTFTLNGISKRFGSPDLKLAWIAVSGPRTWVDEVGAQLELANDTFLSANSYSQHLLPDLFLTMDDWQEKVRRVLATNRNEVRAWLAKESRVSGVLPRGGIHGLWRFEGLPDTVDDESWAVMLLKSEKIALHPGFFYDVEDKGVWLVYSLLKEPGAFRRGLDRLARAFSENAL